MELGAPADEAELLLQTKLHEDLGHLADGHRFHANWRLLKAIGPSSLRLRGSLRGILKGDDMRNGNCVFCLGSASPIQPPAMQPAAPRNTVESRVIQTCLGLILGQGCMAGGSARLYNRNDDILPKEGSTLRSKCPLWLWGPRSRGSRVWSGQITRIPSPDLRRV